MSPTLTAFAVLEAPGGYVAYKLTIPTKGPQTREALCDPCHKSLAYQYLVAHMNRRLVEDMIESANREGSKNAG